MTRLVPLVCNPADFRSSGTTNRLRLNGGPAFLLLDDELGNPFGGTVEARRDEVTDRDCRNAEGDRQGMLSMARGIAPARIRSSVCRLNDENVV